MILEVSPFFFYTHTQIHVFLNWCKWILKTYIPCLSASECTETNALIAGYVILETDANIPAAHIILCKYIDHLPYVQITKYKNIYS